MTIGKKFVLGLISGFDRLTGRSQPTNEKMTEQRSFCGHVTEICTSALLKRNFVTRGDIADANCCCFIVQNLKVSISLVN